MLWPTKPSSSTENGCLVSEFLDDNGELLENRQEAYFKIANHLHYLVNIFILNIKDRLVFTLNHVT